MTVEDRIIALIVDRFIARTDVKAVQGRDGAYRPVQNPDGTYSPWKRGDIRSHLRGDAVYGHYLLDRNDSCKLFAIDIDLDKTGVDPDGTPIKPRDVWAGPDCELRRQLQKEMRALGEGIAYRAKRQLGRPMAVAYSGGKGVHVYGFMDGLVPAAEVRAEVHKLLVDGPYEAVKGKNFWKHWDQYQSFTIESFPKQDSTRGTGGFGNLMRLPLGKNLKSGNSGFFLDSNAPLGELVVMDPLQALKDGTV